jgi:hypothetical protein
MTMVHFLLLPDSSNLREFWLKYWIAAIAVAVVSIVVVVTVVTVVVVAVAVVVVAVVVVVVVVVPVAVAVAVVVVVAAVAIVLIGTVAVAVFETVCPSRFSQLNSTGKFRSCSSFRVRESKLLCLMQYYLQYLYYG